MLYHFIKIVWIYHLLFLKNICCFVCINFVKKCGYLYDSAVHIAINCYVMVAVMTS